MNLLTSPFFYDVKSLRQESKIEDRHCECDMLAAARAILDSFISGDFHAFIGASFKRKLPLDFWLKASPQADTGLLAG